MSSDSESRLQPDRPIVGVGVVVWRDNRFLLVKRSNEPNKGQWSIPGGAQHLGETVFEAAAREVKEETGLIISGLSLIGVVDGIFRNDENKILYHYTLVDIMAESLQGDPVAADDAIAANWFSLSDLPALNLWSETERIISQSALKGFPHHRP